MKADFWQYTDEQKLSVFNEIKENTKLSPNAVEKDWWVSHVILALWNIRCADALTFKGGTSLSKAWNATHRFSEDVDISIDKSFFGLSGETRSSRDRIRKLSREYIREEVMPELQSTLATFGANLCEVTFKLRQDSDADPTVLLIPYRSVLPEDPYIKGSIKVEFSCRNMREPREMRRIKPIVCECSPVIECPDIVVPTVVPTRTFLEKVFLLHEEHQKDYPRYKRMSRHLYDLAMLDEAGWADKAMADRELFDAVVEHRRTFNAMRGIDYSGHVPQNLKILPPAEVIGLWKEDYKVMCEGFIYGPAPSFKELCARIESIEERLHAMSD